MTKFLSAIQSPRWLALVSVVPIKLCTGLASLSLYSILTAGFVLLNVCLVHAQTAPVKQWDKTFGGSGADELSQTISTTDGGYLLASTSYSGIGGDRTQASQGGGDYWIVKTNSSGDKLWDKRFGTSANDYLASVIQTTDGGYLLGGYTTSDANGDKSQAGRGGNDYWIVKVSSSGNKEWDKRFGGDDNDRLQRMLQTPDGGYLLAGLSNSEANGDKSENSLVGEADEPFFNWEDYWVIKLNSSGNKLWDKTLGNFYEETNLGALLSTSDGGYLIGGTRYWASGDAQTYNILKFNSSGEQQWSRYFDGRSIEELYDVVQTADGGYLLGGISYSGVGGSKSEPGIGIRDYWIIKVNSTGVKEWDHVYGTSGDDILSRLVTTTDGGFLLAGSSDGGAEYNKTEPSWGETDYWLVKVNSSGEQQWDKRFGGDKADILTSIIVTSDNSYLLSGYSASGISGDKSQPNKGETDNWLVKAGSGDVCTASGTILREYWANVPGKAIATIPVNTTPTSFTQLTSFETASNQADNYGERIRGYLCAPLTGSYTFYIAGDDNCELYLSTDDDPSKKVKIASIGYFTGIREWTKYPSQKSVAIQFVAGKKYYIEALHKEGLYSDNLAVGWQAAPGAPITVIPGSALSPYIPQGAGKISREYWANVTGSLVSDIPVNTAPTTINEITSFETATNSGNNYGQRIRGYVHPQISGNYTFYIAGDDRCELWLSTNDDPANKSKIASVPYFTSVRQWDKYSNQKSATLYLVAGRKYYIEALHKEGPYSDNLAVGWMMPSQTTISVITGNYLSPFSPSTNPIARTGQEQNNVYTSQVSVYPNPFESKLTLQTSQSGKIRVSIIDNLGRAVYQTTHVGQASELELDLSKAQLKAGVYFVSIQAEGEQTRVVRVVKK